MRPSSRPAAALATGLLLATAAAALLLGAGPAAGGGLSLTQLAPRGGVALAGSPYRWQTFVVGRRRPVTVVARVDRSGGEIGRRWTIRGRWHLGAPALDGEGAGVAARAGVLVLDRWDPAPRGLRRRTHLAILDTGPRRRGSSSFRRVSLKGDYTVDAISPAGGALYLVHTLLLGKHGPRSTIVPFDLRTLRMARREERIRFDGEVQTGTRAARTQNASGRRVYTLLVTGAGRKARLSLLGLDTVRRRLRSIELVGLRGYRDPFALDLRIDPDGRRLLVRRGGRVLARVRLGRLAAPPPAAESANAPASTDPVGVFSRVIGSSLGGRPIELKEVGDLALPMRVLAFGCVHGDECGAEAVEPLGVGGCPDGEAHVDVVPNLDPDGSARRSRLNERGVDLNRNFATAWRPIDPGGGPEYSGPRPFSEPETRLAARLIRRLEPQVTLWFHQHWGLGSYVRAWGQSVPAARRFAKLAGIDFRLEHWEAGTAPHWQNHRFPGTASFVVELPRGKLPQPLLIRLDEALGRLGEEVGEDPRVARKG